jgi:hypothetical protein
MAVSSTAPRVASSTSRSGSDHEEGTVRGCLDPVAFLEVESRSAGVGLIHSEHGGDPRCVATKEHGANTLSLELGPYSQAEEIEEASRFGDQGVACRSAIYEVDEAVAFSNDVGNCSRTKTVRREDLRLELYERINIT